jgi:tRNA-specific 2-thiouridylase
MARNELIVVQGHEHPLLLNDGLKAGQLHWISEEQPITNWVYAAKTRYRQPDAPCEIDAVDAEEVTIKFGQKQWAITPGQSAVVYESNVCLGGGIITGAL